MPFVHAVVGHNVLGLAVLFFLIPLALASMVFWIWMLISAIQNQGLSDNERICWVLVIVFLHLIGALLYLIIAHRKQPPPPRQAV
jgi:heme/copper-type cytochrome/quinol oxidase subunit 2